MRDDEDSNYAQQTKKPMRLRNVLHGMTQFLILSK